MGIQPPAVCTHVLHQVQGPRGEDDEEAVGRQLLRPEHQEVGTCSDREQRARLQQVHPRTSDEGM